MGLAAIAGPFGGPTVSAQELRLTQSPARDASRLKPPSVGSAPGPIIPGLREGAVPQGIAYSDARKRVLISHYLEKGPARVSVLSASTGKMQACLTLHEPTGRPHTGHVGGIAVLNDSLFVASSGRVLRYKLAPFLSKRPPSAVRAIGVRKCETKASFCAATAEFLLVGEFAYGKRFKTSAAHRLTDRRGVEKYAWVCGYAAADPLGAPKFVLSIRQKVQGICVGGRRVFLSVSYGRTNRSIIAVYRNPIGAAAHRMVELNGKRIPLWFLDGENYLGEIDFPPMSEGIVTIGRRLAVLSESGARRYQSGGKGPLDRVLLLDVANFK